MSVLLNNRLREVCMNYPLRLPATSSSNRPGTRAVAEAHLGPPIHTPKEASLSRSHFQPFLHRISFTSTSGLWFRNRHQRHQAVSEMVWRGDYVPLSSTRCVVCVCVCEAFSMIDIKFHTLQLSPPNFTYILGIPRVRSWAQPPPSPTSLNPSRKFTVYTFM